MNTAEVDERSYEDQLRDALADGDIDEVRRLRRIAQAMLEKDKEDTRA